MNKQPFTKTTYALMIVLLALAFLPARTAHAATVTWDGSSSTDWATAANWDTNSVPASGDDVIIGPIVSPTNWPTLAGSTSIASLTINGQTATASSRGGCLTISTGVTLTVSGNLDIIGATGANATGNQCGATAKTDGIVMSGTAGMNVGGNVTFTPKAGGAGYNEDPSIEMGSGTMNVAGDWTFAGKFTAGTGTVIFNGSSAQTLGGSQAKFYNVTINNASGVTLNSNEQTMNTLTVQGGILDLVDNTFNIAGGGITKILTVNNGASLRIGTNKSMPTGYTTYTFGATSNVEYYGTAQAVSTQTYGNLILSGTGIKTINSSTTSIATTLWIKGPGGTGNAQVTLSAGIVVNAANLWLGDDGMTTGNWGGNTCAGGCTVNSTYFTASTGYVHVTSGSLPVTMNYFHAKYQNSSLSIDWSTGTETGNVGFNLYAQDATGKHKLNAKLIPSTGFTTHTPQDYHFAASGLSFSGTLTFYLEDIDFLGKTMLHGPFSVNQVYGQRVVGTPTNWQQIQAECSQHAVLGKRCAGY
jgi:hypothetical protein